MITYKINIANINATGPHKGAVTYHQLHVDTIPMSANLNTKNMQNINPNTPTPVEELVFFDIFFIFDYFKMVKDLHAAVLFQLLYKLFFHLHSKICERYRALLRFEYYQEYSLLSFLSGQYLNFH